MKLVVGKSVKKIDSDGGEEEKVKGVVPDNSSKVHTPNDNVGCSLGLTINLGNYESLRIDVWGAAKIEKGETRGEAIENLAEELADTLKKLQERYE